MSSSQVYAGSSETQHEPPPIDALPELRQSHQWVIWRYESKRKPGGKPTKVLYTPGTNRKASTTDPTTWRSWDEAVAAVQRGEANGIGFVFTEDDPYFGIDLDGCRNLETGEIDLWALAIIEQLATYAEPSPTGTGVHIIGRGVKPGTDCRKGSQIECYDTERYFTVTGCPLPGHETIRNCQRNLTAWYLETWPDPEPTAPHPKPAPNLNLDDHALIGRLRRESGGKAARLLDGDAGDYPSPSEAREGLAWKCRYYRVGAEQIARILVAHGPWNDDEPARERQRKAKIDAASAVKNYRGPFYDPAWGSTATSGGTDTGGDAEGSDCADARAALAAAEEHVASLQKMLRMERETRKEAEEKAARLQADVSALIHTVLNPELKHNQIVAMVATWGRVASKPRNDDGTVEISAAEISNDYRPRVKAGEHTPTFNPSDGTRPRMARSATKRVMSDLIDAGIITANPVPKRIEREGDIDYTTTVWHVEPAPSLAAHLAPAVAFRPETPEARQPRTVTPPCQHCGEVHSRTQRTYCNGCGAETEPPKIIPADEPVKTDDDRVDIFSTRETPTPRVSVPRVSTVDKTSTRDAETELPPRSSPLRPDPTLRERFAAGGWD